MGIFDMSELYTIEKDDKGREIAIPKIDSLTYLAMTWVRKMECMGRTAGLRPRADLDAFQKKIIKLLEVGGKDAILFGRAGSGKTTVALHALRKIHMDGGLVLSIRFAQFKIQMEPRYCDEHEISPHTILDEHAAPDYLLVDDLGYGGTQVRPSEHEQRIFFDLINAREGSGRRTWVVTNPSRENLYQCYGDAAISRLEVRDQSVIGDFTDRKNYRF